MEAKIEQPQMGLTFEDVWAAIMKTQETIEKSQIESEKSKAEFDARLEKSQIEFEKSNAEFDARLEKSKAEFDAQLKSMREEFKISQARIDAIIDRTQAQVDKTAASVDKLSKNLGGIGESLGALIETLISAKLWEKFDAYNYNFKRAYRRIPLYDENSKILTDIDILLSDGG
ncbi:MAG: hypothetical protein Ta2F_09030 [Termitinemataceae bacterium]|nr:MAG: hypothetical protein Ta2F_09030 [Termitinemataceae bacterium]